METPSPHCRDLCFGGHRLQLPCITFQADGGSWRGSCPGTPRMIPAFVRTVVAVPPFVGCDRCIRSKLAAGPPGSLFEQLLGAACPAEGTVGARPRQKTQIQGRTMTLAMNTPFCGIGCSSHVPLALPALGAQGRAAG